MWRQKVFSRSCFIVKMSIKLLLCSIVLKIVATAKTLSPQKCRMWCQGIFWLDNAGLYVNVLMLKNTLDFRFYWQIMVPVKLCIPKRCQILKRYHNHKKCLKKDWVKKEKVSDRKFWKELPVFWGWWCVHWLDLTERMFRQLEGKFLLKREKILILGDVCC